MKSRKKVIEGEVVSTKMDKTIVVKTVKFKKHPLYKKLLRTHKNYKAHDEKKQAKDGDTVRIIETRPYSKEKRFKLLEIVKEHLTYS